MKSAEELMAAFRSDTWNSERERLEAALLDAAQALLIHSDSAGVVIELDGIRVSAELISAPRVDA